MKTKIIFFSMNIFITGATGFIGRHLTEKLLGEGNIVYILSRKKTDFPKAGSEKLIPVIGDINKKNSYEFVFDNDIDTIYHLAAIPGQKWGLGRKDYYETNVRATSNLLEACLGRVKRFIFASSINAIPEIFEKDREDYGRSKREAEKIVESFQGKGLETVILRPAIVYGPGDTGGMMPKLLQLIKKKKFRLIGSGKNVVPLVYIDDLIEALLLAQKGKSGSPCEIIGPENISLEKIAETASELLGVPFSKTKIPVWIARIAAFFSENTADLLKTQPLVTQHRVSMITRHRIFSPEKARCEIDYHPRTKFRDGLREAISWYKENGYL